MARSTDTQLAPRQDARAEGAVPPIIGGGEMGRLVRGTDWSATPLGAYATWPQSLRSSLSLVLNAKGIAALYWGPEQWLLYNDAYGEALGDRHPRAFGHPMPEVLTDIAPVLGPQVAEVLRTGEGFAIENLPLTMRRHGRDEETVWTYSFSPVQGEEGGFAGVLLLATEMTRQKAAERSEEGIRSRLETALRVARLGTFDWTPATGAIDVDGRGREMFGLAPEGALTQEDTFGRIVQEDVERVQVDASTAMGIDQPFDRSNLGRIHDYTYNLVRPDGSRRAILSSGAIVENPDGTRRMVGTFNDVTEIRRVQAELQALNATLEGRVATIAQERDRIWQVSLDMLLVSDLKGVFLSVNPAWTRALGWTEAELVGRTSEWLEHPDDKARTRAEVARLAKGSQTLAYENRFRTRAGDYRTLSWTAVPEGDRFYCVARDITADKEQTGALLQAEEALRQSQKMEAVGQLTGGVAHDFNNLLTVIKSSSDLLKRPDLALERRNRYIAAISDTVDRAAKLTGQLLAFARRQALKPEVFAVGDSVCGLADMMGTLTGSRIRITTDLPDVPCFINADPSQFDTALVNLAVNARDAMDGEGHIHIRVEALEAIPAIRTHPVVDGPCVAVSLGDTGSGIPPDILERIFEPFFTTKEVGKGTGLGLSQVFGFAKQSGGDTTVTSTPGAGTTFTIYLPRVAAPASGPAIEEAVEQADGHGLRVLVVEDNVDVGTFAVQTLSDLGFTSVLAADGTAALARLAEDADRFDIVFSDVMMPGMSGIDLGHEIRRLHHDLPVVLTSGYSQVLAQNGTSGFELLHKPYSVEQLSQVLRKAASWQRRKRLIGR